MDSIVWNEDKFLNDLSDEDRIYEINSVLAEYYSLRNISCDQSQKKVISKEIFQWSKLPGNKHLKPSFMIWALRKYSDLSNSNISALQVLEWLRRGVSDDLYRKVYFDYLDSKALPRASNDVKNEESRMLAYQKIKEMVLNGKIDYDSGWWIPAINYLAKDLKYMPEKNIIEKYQDIAKKTYLCKVNEDLTFETSNSVRAELNRIKQKIESTGESEGVKVLRRKLILENYIKTNA